MGLLGACDAMVPIDSSRNSGAEKAMLGVLRVLRVLWDMLGDAGRMCELAGHLAFKLGYPCSRWPTHCKYTIWILAGLDVEPSLHTLSNQFCFDVQ